MTRRSFFDPRGRESSQAIYKRQQRTREDHVLQVEKPKGEETDRVDRFQRIPVPFIRKCETLA